MFARTVACVVNTISESMRCAYDRRTKSSLRRSRIGIMDDAAPHQSVSNPNKQNYTYAIGLNVFSDIWYACSDRQKQDNVPVYSFMVSHSTCAKTSSSCRVYGRAKLIHISTDTRGRRKCVKYHIVYEYFVAK